MKYNPSTNDVILGAVTHGSHLYGTNTPSSDFDFKVVTLPRLDTLLLGKRLEVLKFKFDAAGKPVPEDASMPADGYEAEHTPLQKFVNDYLSGQAYAVEFVYAFKQGFADANAHDPELFEQFAAFIDTLPVHRNVDGMVGFAMKQTFDYVRRGERYNSAVETLAIVDSIIESHKQPIGWGPVRLDTRVNGTTHLDEIARRTGLVIGSTINANKTIRTLKLNGREYLETTTLEHLRTAVQKLVDQYGVRATDAASANVEWKSLAHAVRVYQQVIELLQTGFIKFPRPNAMDLLAIRKEQVPLEVVKNLLRDLDDEVQRLMMESTFAAVDHELKAQVERNLFKTVLRMHAFPTSDS